MAAGVESSPGEGRAVGLAMCFSLDDATSFTMSSPRLPRRLQRRLSECRTPPKSTVEEIQAKLRDADLRRQQYYEKLSSKARGKPRSPSRSSSSEDDLGQRLEAKLLAAEQKRLSILAKAQMRLTRLDELRQAAKSGVQMRYEKEHEKLGTKVESRVQQAATNRMLMLKAYRQRRATLKERSSQSLLRRIARDSKHKERVHAAIQQKRAAAEKKRLGLLEAEKKRARARMMQVWRVANSVSHQREIERRRLRDQLEDRLQRVLRQRDRAEYLRQRGRLHNPVYCKWNRMHKQADHLSRKVARCWRQFLKLRKTTFALAKTFDALEMNEQSVKSMPFERLALLIESPATLQTVKALLDRFESRLKLSTAVSVADNPSFLDNIDDHLLKRVASPKRRGTPRTARSKDVKKVGLVRGAATCPDLLSRYPVRVALCAYMILSHPDAVFSGQGEREFTLAKSAEGFIRELEFLIKIILEGPIQTSDENSDSKLQKCWTFRSQLAAFDKAWCSYLNCFVVWKVKDAQLLEKDLVRAACQLELSMIQTCKLTPGGESVALTHDMKAVQKQVREDQELLREKVKHLSGDAGIERMESALSETRSRYFQAKENGSPGESPITQFISPSPPSSSGGPCVASSDKVSDLAGGIETPRRVVRALFKEDGASSSSGSFSAPVSGLDNQLGSADKNLIAENELIVNEFLHEQRQAFSDRSSLTDEAQKSIKVKIRETMENAFWDGIMESMKGDDPDYDRVFQLMREVRDEICEMAPHNWKQEIIDAIDIDVLSQVLNSGKLDIDYLGGILEYALVTLQKLSAPANDDEVKANHQKLLNELYQICQASNEWRHSCEIAMIKGLRFVLGQIQVLKLEISKAWVQYMEPLLKGPVGLDYLRNAFANRYGSPSDANTSLPATLQWLSSFLDCKDQEWDEHTNSLSSLMSYENLIPGFLPSAALRTGGGFLVKTNASRSNPPAIRSVGNQQPECKGGKVDLLVRLGLLKLVSGIAGLTQEALPETLMLNLSRLRSVQSQIQKIIVISTSLLVCQQIFLSEAVITLPTDMENILSKCVEGLSDVLDRDEDAGIKEIVDIISKFPRDGDETVDPEKLQQRRTVMARVLAKSLQAGDPVFEMVSGAVYLATRGVLLGGSGPQGRKLAEVALRRVGAAVLTERVVEAAEVLVVVASVSASVHGPWYTHLTANM